MPYQSAADRMDRQEAVRTAFMGAANEDISEMRQWRIQAQKQWGEIAQKTGPFVEDSFPQHGIYALGRYSIGWRRGSIGLRLRRVVFFDSFAILAAFCSGNLKHRWLGLSSNSSSSLCA